MFNNSQESVTKKDGWLKQDASEEAYFNDSDDDEPLPVGEENTPSPFKRGLVDYAEEEEDELFVKKSLVNKSPKLKFALKKTNTETDPLAKKSRVM